MAMKTPSAGAGKRRRTFPHPGFTIESNDSRSIYKPHLHVQYSFDNGFYVAARYRYEYTRYPNDAGKDDDKVNRGDAWAGLPSATGAPS